MAIAFNVEPYWDYFEASGADGLSPKEKYNRVLFRPGKAVQARELTQLQSSLQNQISATGDHLFKEGSNVLGELSVHNECDFLKITTSTTDVTDFIGVTLTDGTTTAKILHAVAIDGADPVTLYVKYLSGPAYTASSTVTGTGIVVTDITAVGLGSIATIDNGVYYIKKNFVTVKSKTIVLSKYTTNASIDIGLTITESLVSSGSDATLNDNATGTPNESAPGAHRYKLSAIFSTRASTSTTGDFVLLVRLIGGAIDVDNRKTAYNKIEDTLARRTHDESGNYTVTPFQAAFSAHASDSTKFVTVVEPAKAYVHGYEIEKVSKTNVDINKARSSQLVTDRVVQVESNNYIDISTMVSYPDTVTLEKINIKNESAAVVGTCRVRAIEGLTATTQRLHVFDYITTTPHTIDTTADDYTLAGTTGSFTATIIDANLGDDTAIFAFPQSRVKTCDSVVGGGTPDFNYQFSSNRNMGTPTSALSGGSVQFSGSSSNETIVTANAANLLQWILINNATNAKVTIAVGDIAVNNPGSGASTITITGLGAIANATSLSLFAPTTRTLDHKSKDKASGNTPVTYNGPTDYRQWQRLNHCDIIKITSVLDVANVNITDNFEFDTGQTGSYYGHGKWRIKSTSNYALSGNITVHYDYFTHTAGDFFTIDSYDLANDIDYEDIPSFEGVELRSAVDFRPRMGDDQTVDTFNAATSPGGTNAIVGVCPTPNSQFQTDLQFYLPRRDLVYLDKTGFIGVTQGVSSLTPLLPEAPKDSMVLYHLTIPAYTLTPDSVGIKFIDNKRYTMRDIGKIEKRVQNLEYYTTLSLLETEANALQVLNPVTGTLRFKAGFLVDSFKSTAVGRTNSLEYKAGIDPATGSLRPLFSEGNANLLYDSNTTNSTTTLTQSLITLPYTHTPLITQKQSSGEINVNPYSVHNWTGRIEIDPHSDEWKDIDRRPQVIINNDSVYNALLDVLEASTATGTVWGSWTSNWTGSSDHREDIIEGGRIVGDTTTTTRTGTKSREGIKTSIETGTVIEDQGDRQVSIAFRPYIRSRVIHFKATLLRPNTQVYAWFDGVQVANYVRTYDAGDTHAEPLVGPNTVTAHPLGANTLTTDAAGTISGTFFIPNNTATNFTSGQKNFILVDSTTPEDLETVTTFAGAMYYAKGQLEAVEQVIISTRTPTVKVEAITDTENISSSSSSTNRHPTPPSSPPSSSVPAGDPPTNTWHERHKTIADTQPPYAADIISRHIARNSTNTLIGRGVTGAQFRALHSCWRDPLAQSIEINLAGGCFVTSLDLFVSNKDAAIPLNVEIRTMDNGHPTQTIVPFSEVSILPAAITADGVTATQFVFPDPVYLQQNIEYCFVVWANSDNYKVRYATQGVEDTNGDMIIKQPYNGVMFKSQNASTWTPDQGSDLMFELHRAVFTVDAAKGASFINQENPSRNLQINPFLTTAGGAGSNTITVSHKNHGMSAADTVTIAGATVFNGVALIEINKTHTIVTAKRNSYTIATTTGGAVTAGTGGGSAVAATQHVGYNILYPTIQEMVFPGTSMDWGIMETTEGGSMSTTYQNIVTNTNYYPTVPMTIKSGADYSMRLSASMYSTANNLSPVIDVSRCSLIAISNIVDANTDTVETDKSSGSALAKYLTKTVQLDSESNILKVFLDTNRPQATGIDVYYKVGSDAGLFDDNAYVAMTPTAETGSAVPYSDDPNIYKEVEYSHDFSGDSPATQFTMFAIKIVFTSTTTAKVPSVRNLRAIALV